VRVHGSSDCLCAAGCRLPTSKRRTEGMHCFIRLVQKRQAAAARQWLLGAARWRCRRQGCGTPACAARGARAAWRPSPTRAAPACRAAAVAAPPQRRPQCRLAGAARLLHAGLRARRACVAPRQSIGAVARGGATASRRRPRWRTTTTTARDWVTRPSTRFCARETRPWSSFAPPSRLVADATHAPTSLRRRAGGAQQRQSSTRDEAVVAVGAVRRVVVEAIA